MNNGELAQAALDAPGWVLIIGAIATGLVLVVNAVGQWWGHQDAKRANETRTKLVDHAEQADRKLDVIHDLTNSNMTALKAQLAVAMARIEKLEELLAQHHAAAATVAAATAAATPQP